MRDVDHDSLGHAGDLFVVSNLGQARNAALVAAAEGRSDCSRVAVVATPTSVDLARGLARFVEERGLAATTVMLPELPTAPRPLLLRRIVTTYRRLADEHPAHHLWLANTNVHYGVLAAIYQARGSRICYFEEGLGTYRRGDDPALALWRPGESIGALLRRDIGRYFGGVGEVRSARDARRIARNGPRFVRSAASHLTSSVAAKPWYRTMVARTSGAEAVAFLRPWSEFDEACVVFPLLLDPGVVSASRVHKLEMVVSRTEVQSAERALAAVDLPRDASLFVSQPYGDRGLGYYRAVASALAQHGFGVVYVQPHPRERSYNIADMSRALRERGVEFVHANSDRLITAEALLATGKFNRCVGLTSTILLYGPRLFQDVQFAAIGASVRDELRMAAADSLLIDRLDRDVQLLDFVSGSISNNEPS